MITIQNIHNAIEKANSIIKAKNLPPEKIESMSKNLDMDLMEYSRFQELKSALAGSILSMEAAQFIYNKIGNTPEKFNKLPLAEKWVFTELFQRLITRK